MKKILVLALLAIAFAGCEKENENLKTITNLSGETWYETSVWFAKTLEHDELTGRNEVGTVEVGKSCNVSTEDDYFYVSFKDKSGKSRMSKTQQFVNGKATVSQSNLY